MPQISDEEYDQEQKVLKKAKRLKLLNRNILDNCCMTIFLFSFFMTFKLVLVWKMTFLQYLVFFDSLWISTYICTTRHYYANKKNWGYMPPEMFSATVRTL